MDEGKADAAGNALANARKLNAHLAGLAEAAARLITMQAMDIRGLLMVRWRT
jgi:hypothetical protein